MSELQTIIDSLKHIDALVDNALEREVADVVEDAIIESARRNVYEAYTPSPYFLDKRREGSGGILDRTSMNVEVKNNTLTVQDVARFNNSIHWQHLWGGKRPNENLSDAIACGERRFNMQKAGQRPFHEDAEKEVIQSGAVDDALRRGLARQGL